MDLQTLSHDKIPLAPIGSVKTNKDPLQGKTKQQNQNCEAAKLHKEAETIKTRPRIYIQPPIGLKLSLLGVGSCYSRKVNKHHQNTVFLAMKAQPRSKR